MLRIFLMMLGLSLTAMAQDASTVSVSIPEGKSVEMHLPKDWTSKQLPPANGRPSTLEAFSKDHGASLQVTFLDDKDNKFGTQQEIEAMVTKTANKQFIPGSVEKEVALKSLKSKAGLNSYAEFTDADLVGKKTKVGQFKVLANGLIKIGNAAGIFTIMGSTFTDEDYKAAFKVISEALLIEK